MGIIWWLIVGLIAGWLTGKIMGGTGKGALMDIIVGLVGALVGGFLMQMVGFRRPGRNDLHDPRRHTRSGAAHLDLSQGHGRQGGLIS